ncbi:uncharacterized protein LOC120598635 isoform X2 [Pteropus medius]|uniref:uncharacterized protein LOC120598635 isoform X2 n=1 Tax=Pteropus vampyrus TaxID=132908 RepID=UPI00196A4B8D|nr:uncharacterized protein LOC120598635 isoform X2 [Pteropus giganteus]
MSLKTNSTQEDTGSIFWEDPFCPGRSAPSPSPPLAGGGPVDWDCGKCSSHSRKCGALWAPPRSCAGASREGGGVRAAPEQRRVGAVAECCQWRPLVEKTNVYQLPGSQDLNCFQPILHLLSMFIEITAQPHYAFLMLQNLFPALLSYGVGPLCSGGC